MKASSQNSAIETKMKKAPQAPRRFKSAYMFFSTDKHKQVRIQMAARQKKMTTPEVAKIVSQAWKELSTCERQYWYDMAERDKARFEFEKSIYSGPWKIPKKMTEENGLAPPRRPMSAFLAYSLEKRDLVKRQCPGLGATAISAILSEMWKTAPEREKDFYRNRDQLLREQYKKDMSQYKRIFETERNTREQIALLALDVGINPVESDFISSNEECHLVGMFPYPGESYSISGFEWID